MFQAIVFVVGGGNYIEYQNLVDYSKVQYYCIITTGTTVVITAGTVLLYTLLYM